MEGYLALLGGLLLPKGIFERAGEVIARGGIGG